ncbi:MFS transporter [Streptomyces sp. NEAU-YJ-81]|uniref:MFS transporter n=1 Tax=Streptomyces sp. NEAU-YJ-81 TaxID=2820288 RepID=UPI001ABCEEDF|nr:MFS transporter [Streptomyces sp. NEAU-YJ-81]MBO3679965.1 MFS transporter [Streptomyces sp. NEAU-YJ-81]
MTTPSSKAQGSGVPAATPDPAPAPTPSRRRWLILAVASAAQFLAVLDMIAVNIAFPAIGADFRSASTAELSWVLNAYTIVLAALLVPAGRLADAIGGRRSFLTGIALFGLASVACGAAPGLGTLIAARVVQGVAAAVLVPTSLSLALPAFPPRERATAVGLITGALAVAHVRRHPDPVVDPALFRTRAFTAATLGLLSYFLAYAASILAATLLFTGAWGWSSARAGLAVTPWPLTVLVVSMLSGRIVRALGERTTAVVGGLCFAAGPVWWLLLAGGDGAHYAVEFMPGLVLTGIGAGLYQPVMFSAAGLLPARQLSLGSGVLMMSRQGGSALGVAALVVITGGAARPGLDALRAGWVFTAVTAALAAVAGAALRTGVRVDPGESGGSGTDPLRHH